MREIYFRDPTSNAYIAIPYRDRTRPPVSRWEIQAAEKRLREAGYARVDEVLIFQAIEEMRRLELESEHKTKKARRARELRHRPPRQPSTTPAKPGSSAVTVAENDQYNEAFEGILEPNDMNGEHLSPKTRELLDRPIEERIAHIQKDSWIPYSQANKILQQLEDLLNHPKVRPYAEPHLSSICNAPAFPTNRGCTIPSC
jgi:hypothetical protein